MGREMGAEGRTVGSDSCLELERPSGIIYSKLLVLCMGHLSLEKGHNLPQVTQPVTADPRTEEDLGSWILSFLLATVMGMTSCQALLLPALAPFHQKTKSKNSDSKQRNHLAEYKHGGRQCGLWRQAVLLEPYRPPILPRPVTLGRACNSSQPPTFFICIKIQADAEIAGLFHAFNI